MKTILIVLAGLMISLSPVYAQQFKQTVRGEITDKASGTPLTGAIVMVVTTDPVLGATTDEYGKFKIDDVPVARHTIVIRYTGYKEVVLSNIAVNSGKETVLNATMEEDISLMAAVEVVEEKDKKEALNSMATVSARTFSVEETQKFAAAVNDPGRMAVSYAGVVSTDDGSNQISVRGNSPYGLLWRMEGIDIPNPNHFASSAAAGGGISILSAQTLANSDFMTGAFAAEYGNALGGVFDLRLRKGNNERREYTFQVGALGMDVAAEGPIRKGYAGSYLVNYRYSTLSLLGKMGVPLGDAVTNFQDVSFNLYLPDSKLGTFQLFGFGGLSSQHRDAARDTSKWENFWQRYDDTFFSNTGAVGLKHVYRLSDNGFLQTTLMGSGNDYSYRAERVDDDFTVRKDYEERFVTTKLTVSSVYQHKLNARHTVRTGVYFNRHGFNLTQDSRDLQSLIYDRDLDASGNASTWQAFAQWKYRMTDRLTFNTGLHSLYVPMNETVSLEPRAAVRFQYSEKQAFTMGYGLHSQMQPVGIYRAHYINESGQKVYPNENLGLNKSHHFVVGSERSLTRFMYIKAEAYYQHLFDIAVSADPTSTLSTLNNTQNYITDPLVSRGYGRNYGVELTLEQFTRKGMYFLFSSSLYQSEYKALDGVWRNTRFNGNYTVTFTGGKEWAVGKEEKNRTLGLNIRLISAGGLRETPVDVAASLEAGEEIRVESRAYEIQNKDYFRTDLRVSLKRNRAKSTTTLALDLQNATNHKNIYGTWFDIESGQMQTSNQTPLIPILSYKIEF